MLNLWELLSTALDSIRMLLWPRHVNHRSLHTPPPNTRNRKDVVSKSYDCSMDDFLREAKRQLEGPLQLSGLLAISDRLQEQYMLKLQSGSACMLPSYIHTLPTGQERGTYLALDVGGSTFRVAAVQLYGRKKDGSGKSMEILKMQSFRIDNLVKALRGHAFFDWMAEKIEDVLSDTVIRKAHGSGVFAMGLAWSFPVEQTSTRGARIIAMGKGFCTSEGLEEDDLGKLLTHACCKRKLNVQLDAIINDGQATLMTRAYQDDAECFGLILGTGTNMAINLPTTAFGKSKFGSRPQSWHSEAKNVLVNTEFSMFGKGILPATKWDDMLNSEHSLPDFQPFEYMIGGRYIGEIVRIILVDAIRTTGLLGGHFPHGFLEPYALETSTLAVFEDDESPDLRRASSVLEKHHSMRRPPSPADLGFIQQITKLVSHRAAAFLATGVHAMYSLRRTLLVAETSHISVGCNGSIIERYPKFRSVAQSYLDNLIHLSGGGGRDTVTLEVAYESAIFGAAVAACCLEGQD